MAILALDFGGTSIKHGIWVKNRLEEKSSIILPNTWEEVLLKIEEIINSHEKKYFIKGIAVSVPGAVNQEKDEIFGLTAIPYIHKRKFTQELSEYFCLPVTMENDANCAALSEIWKGNASEDKDILYFVFGTGVGGAIIQNKMIHHGKNQFGGEFGYMMLNEEGTFSELASVVQATNFFNRLTKKNVNGETLFKLAQSKDHLAEHLISQLCRYSARGIYNLLVSFDPDKIIIGGGLSSNTYFLSHINKEIENLKYRTGGEHLTAKIVASQFHNSANLIGAVYVFLKEYENKY